VSPTANSPEVAFRVALANACGVVYSPPLGPQVPAFAFVACQTDGVFGVELAPAATAKAKKGGPPPEPAVQGSLVAPGMDARKLVMDQGLLYVAAHAGGLHIYDVRNPNHPMPLSKITSSAIPIVENVHVWGGYAMIVGGDGMNARFCVVDVRNVSQPRIVGGYTHVTRDPTNYTSIAFDGRLVYVGTNKGELHVLNLQNLQQITRIGEYFCPRHDFRPPTLSGIVAYPGRVFCADWGVGLIVVDTTNPTNPRQIGMGQGGTQAANAFRVAIDGTVAYVANGWGGLLAVDVAGCIPGAPQGMKPMHLLYEVAPQRCSFIDLALASPYVLLADNGVPQGLTIVRMRGK
jgi:hypothetical protein